MAIEQIIMDIWALPAWRATGLNKGFQHEHEHLPFILKKGSKIRARALAKDDSAVHPAMRLYNDDEKTEVVWDLTQQWTEKTALADSVVLINRGYASQAMTAGITVEYDCADQDKAFLPVFDAATSQHETFIAQWRNSGAPLAFFKARTVQMVIPRIDLEHAAKPSPLHNCHAIADFYDRMQSHFDHLCGLIEGASDAMDRNLNARYLVKANRNGAGAAYFGSAHTAQNGPSMHNYLLGLPTEWLVVHEFGHGYQMNQMSDDVLSLREVWNNIYAALYQYRTLDEDTFIARSGLYWGDPKTMTRSLTTLCAGRKPLGDWGLFERLNFFMPIFMAQPDSGQAFAHYNQHYRRDHESGKTILDRMALYFSDRSYSGQRMDLTQYIKQCGGRLSGPVEAQVAQNDADIYLPLFLLMPDIPLRDTVMKGLGLISAMELVNVGDWIAPKDVTESLFGRDAESEASPGQAFGFECGTQRMPQT